uniref:CHK kinase-like domain-containing protein n=1 Tax=Timema shepardi TaxID=629360 RepID=A0A7R9AW84_TIMSH|nr:unnamed protein product [Timema shepardi]
MDRSSSPAGTMDTGKEPVSPPEWLTAEFLQELIRREDQDPNVTVKLADVNVATNKGDNYLSVIYRVDLECTSRDKTRTSTLIVKCPPLDKLVEKFGEDVGAFKREIFMYRDVIPKMYSIWKKRTGHTLSKRLSPRGYPSSRMDTLILEDLRPLGYKMADRISQLDLDHTCLVLRSLAKLHAMSLAMLEEYPSSFKDLDEPFFTEENKDMISRTFIKPVKASMLLLRQWPGFEHLADRLEEMYANSVDDLIKTVRPDETPLSVLNHGDCWVNNMLFKYSSDTGIVEDIKFLDFQICRFSSPVLDLHYFLYSSVRYDVLKDRDALLAEYYNALLKNLQELGCGRLSYSLEDLKRDFRKKLWFGYISLSTIRVGVMVDPENVPNIADFVDGEAGPEIFLNWYSKSYKEFFKKMSVLSSSSDCDCDLYTPCDVSANRIHKDQDNNDHFNGGQEERLSVENVRKYPGNRTPIMVEEGILRREMNTPISVEIKDVQNAVSVGDNYLSIIRRITLGVSEEGGRTTEKSLIVKDLPKGEMLQKFLKEDGIFKREISMYQKVLPTLYRIAEGKLEKHSLTAKCYPLDNDELLVMEDLRPSGFKLADRR